MSVGMTGKQNCIVDIKVVVAHCVLGERRFSLPLTPEVVSVANNTFNKWGINFICQWQNMTGLNYLGDGKCWAWFMDKW
jgi:hypothetical protein